MKTRTERNIFHKVNQAQFLFQLVLDSSSLKQCLSYRYDNKSLLLPGNSTYTDLLQKANISMGTEISVCNPDIPTSHFPEVSFHSASFDVRAYSQIEGDEKVNAL